MTDTYNGIKEHLNIKVNKHLNDGFANLSHFWLNNKSCDYQYFKLLAKEFLKSEILSTIEEPEQLYIPLKFDVPFPPPANLKFTFIDFFDQTGCIRMEYQNVGGRCAFSREWNSFSKLTYEANFGEIPFGDITQISEKNNSDDDILLAGFPCQPFSIAI